MKKYDLYDIGKEEQDFIDDLMKIFDRLQVDKLKMEIGLSKQLQKSREIMFVTQQLGLTDK